jgi:hypothetical protein
LHPSGAVLNSSAWRRLKIIPSQTKGLQHEALYSKKASKAKFDTILAPAYADVVDRMFVIYDRDQVLGEDAMKAGSGLGQVQMEKAENHVES